MSPDRSNLSQGLTKRRKKLFIVAGLQYDPEKEEVVKKEGTRMQCLLLSKFNFKGGR